MSVSADPHAILAIVLACAAIFLYTRERIPLETSSLAILGFILVWFELFTIEANGERVRAGDFLAGFGNEALLTVVSLIVLTRGLEVTQALQPVGIVLARLWRVRPRFAFLLTMVTAAVLSMFLNNTPVAPVERVPDVPPLLSSLVMRLLHKDATQRPQSAEELGTLLAQIT